MITSTHWETQKQLKERTGLSLVEVNRELRAEMAAKTCECRLEGDEYLLIPIFRRKS